MKWPIKNPASPAVNPIVAISKSLLHKDPIVVLASYTPIKKSNKIQQPKMKEIWGNAEDEQLSEKLK
jgi:hypothetical protein